MSNQTPQISDAEWEVMSLLWEQSPATAQDMINRLANSTDWKPATVKALINRLLKKGALTFKAGGKTYYYSPAVSREACCRVERQTFLQRIYRGSAAPMLMHFLQEQEFSKEELQELKRLLEEKIQKDTTSQCNNRHAHAPCFRIDKSCSASRMTR
ncbi:BlaI/MecI/CopY family transcriptional regulator [Paenibacillus sp. J5C_2022]|uniref:BlaI/MecI/CopY family transcriptional regulator n=1 Tax=Paenibacillus sp. J5C2022 TaxID=2977129 RepID=UPI0021D06024|nr:BlaI/MecI/CopY family transcriptional regulator [Paenibacillus sp. J5C2022]MCU6712682.1 BlaI/MecI/CopY family transcriptional regulator [Paenibacillus sp. J5C2022]